MGRPGDEAIVRPGGGFWHVSIDLYLHYGVVAMYIPKHEVTYDIQ